MRDIRKEIKFNTEEWDIIRKKAEKAGMRTGTYIRKIAVQGCIKHYEVDKFNALRLSLNKVGRELNQIAKVANSTQSVYRKDIEDMCEQIKYLKNIFADYYKPIKPDVIL